MSANAIDCSVTVKVTIKLNEKAVTPPCPSTMNPADVAGSSSIAPLPEASLDPVYAAKAEVLNRAIQDIGFGRYQKWLFVVTGFGWLVDNLWPVVISIILVPVVTEFSFPGPFLSLSQNIGLLTGALVFGLGSDVWGRRISFNSTLLIVGVFATAAAGAPEYIFLCFFASIWSIGVGGNLPVDSAIFLEFLPGTHKYLLTVLSIWWAFGQLLASLIAWAILPWNSCPINTDQCLRWQNMGWRYYVIVMGALMMILWAIRFFIFKLYESPKYLMGRGRDAEAVEVVHKVAAFNGTTSNLTLEDLTRFDPVGGLVGESGVDTSASAAIKRNTEKFKANHIKALFATTKMAWSTSLIIFMWAVIGLAFPLYNSFVPYYLATRGANFGDGSIFLTYRNEVIVSVLGIPGALVAGWLVDLPRVGRKGALASSTLLTGAFLMLGTTARTSNELLGWNCAYTFTSNIMYGVLYAMTPELFPTKDRGTGSGLAASANRIFGVMAPIIALAADLETSTPIWISGALFAIAGFVALLLPLETRGKSVL
ncbi:hypothetical protein FRB96_001798 [Tulasnella sp. 330]|nr:hypothetical protein FRB96_001798 [Tulasnella sp. 330]KAG8880326.1 hypothetical protein FRB97_000939 [Tulasnella sp. 331]